MTDGNLTLTTISSEVLGTLYMTLHETAHKEAPGYPVEEKLTPSERALYESAGEELKARILETSNNRKPTVVFGK